MLCLSSFGFAVLAMAAENKINSRPFTFKLLSISIMVNSHVLNSPSQLQTHLKLLTNSSNILLVHKVVEKRHAASGNAKRSRKKRFDPLLKTSRTSCRKTSCTSRRKAKSHQNIQIHLQMRSMQQVYFENNQASSCTPSSSPNPLHSHAKSKNDQKHTVPRCNSTILQQIQSHTKSCRNAANVHRINGSLYLHTPFCHAVQPRKFPTCNTMQIYIYPSHPQTLVRIAHEVISSQQLQMYRKYLYT